MQESKRKLDAGRKYLFLRTLYRLGITQITGMHMWPEDVSIWIWGEEHEPEF